MLLAKLADDLEASRCYAFERAIQSPAMCMMLRGVRIDKTARDQAIKDHEAIAATKNAQLTELAGRWWDKAEKRIGKCEDGKNHKWPRVTKANPEPLPPEVAQTCEKCSLSRLLPKPLNALSPLQMAQLLYDEMQLPKQRDHRTHEVSTNDECIQKLLTKFPEYEDIFRAILDVRGAHKQIGLLNSRLDLDGRWHSSFNVGATEVDRWSSSKDPFSNGTNLQNIADRSRHVIVPDPGMWIGYADLKSAESRVVAFDARDERYIEAHNGDTHVYVAKLIWPNLPWPGNANCGSDHALDGMCCDRGMAETFPPFSKYKSRRGLGKVIQHGTNIGMTHVGISRENKIPQAEAKLIRAAYLGSFPGIAARQQEIIHEIRTTGALKTFLGRRRQFFGRLWDESTWREGLAQTQQSTVGWLLNMALWRVWNELDAEIRPGYSPHVDDPNRIWLLAQVHDAILFQVREGDFAALERVRELMTIPIPIHGRILTIPVEVLYGKSWRHNDMQELKETI